MAIDMQLGEAEENSARPASLPPVSFLLMVAIWMFPRLFSRSLMSSLCCHRTELRCMDPLGVSASIIAVLRVSGTVQRPSFSMPNGPIQQFRAALEILELILVPVKGWKKVGKAFTWPLERTETLRILSTIERQ